MTRQAFLDLPELSSHFPLVFENSAQLITLAGHCGDCGRTIADHLFRGTATNAFSKVFVIEGVGLCEACDRVTFFRYRLHDDLSLTGTRDGEWCRWSPRPSAWSKIRRFFRSLCLLALLTSCAPEPRACPPCAAGAAPASAPIETCFTPGQDCEARIVARIGAARVSVFVLAYSFTSGPIAAALITAHGKGVDVEIVLDRSDRTGRGSRLAELVAGGVPVWVDATHPGIAHNKTMVYDAETVETGSFNYTAAAQHSNAENMLVIRDGDVAARYLDNWKSHRAHSERVGP